MMLFSPTLFAFRYDFCKMFLRNVIRRSEATSHVLDVNKSKRNIISSIGDPYTAICVRISIDLDCSLGRMCHLS